MIHVDRNSINKPGFFSSRQYSQMQADLAEQLARDEKQKKQARYKFDFSLYPWLAYEWENLYPVCHACNRNKGHHFPLNKDSAHARTASELSKEKPLLLEPCNSRPEKHLSYTRQGLVQGDDEPGETTVEIIGLNRIELRKKRSLHAREVQETLDATAPRKKPGKFSTKVAKPNRTRFCRGKSSMRI